MTKRKKTDIKKLYGDNLYNRHRLFLGCMKRMSETIRGNVAGWFPVNPMFVNKPFDY